MALTQFPIETDKPKIDVTLPVGKHVLELVVEDSAGLRSEPDTVVITVEHVVSAPTITGIKPTSGQQGSVVSAVITGTNLGGATIVKFDGTGVDAGLGSPGADGTQLPVMITVADNAAPGPRGFSVTTPGGTARSPAAVVFTVTAALPTISGIQPEGGMPGDGLEAVILGENLLGAEAVRFFSRRTPSLPDNTVQARIMDRGTANKLPIVIGISRDAPSGPRGFTVETPAGTAASPGDVAFTVGEIGPTIGPTILPTIGPTIFPTIGPTIFPTIEPTILPTIGPTILPTIGPTIFPTIVPTIVPTIEPTIFPTIGPIIVPPIPVGPRDVSARRVSEVKGIGPTFAARLGEKGIATLDQLAALEPGNLAEILKVSEVRAMGFVDEARRLLAT